MRNKEEECLIVSIVSSMKDGDHGKSVYYALGWPIDGAEMSAWVFATSVIYTE